MARMPILYVGGAGKKNKGGRCFFITESAIATMLNKHRRDFAKVEIAHIDDGKLAFQTLYPVNTKWTE
jgi:hypothetical protein